MNLENFKKIFINFYINFNKTGKNIESFPVFFLHGSVGIGKSSFIKELGNILKKNVSVKILSGIDPVEIRGIPVISEKNSEKITLWSRPEILNIEENSILFLDEINAADISIQPVLYSLILDKKIGEYSLPKNSLMICAGNLSQDNAVVNKLSTALSNRLVHIKIEPDFSVWKNWALNIKSEEKSDFIIKKDNISEKIIPEILSFLNFKPEYFHNIPEENEEIFSFPTPRSWEICSDFLKVFDLQENNFNVELIEVVEGIIGKPTAEFVSFLKIQNRIPDINEIFSGKIKEVPEEISLIYSTLNSLIYRLKNLKEKGENIKDKFENACLYVLKISEKNPEISMIFWTDCIKLFQKEFLQLKIFSEIQKKFLPYLI